MGLCIAGITINGDCFAVAHVLIGWDGKRSNFFLKNPKTLIDDFNQRIEFDDTRL